MNLQKAFQQIEEDGFAIVPQVVSQENVAKLRMDLQKAITEDMKEFGGLPGKKENLVVDMVRRGTSFVELLENELMHQVFSHFLGKSCILYSFTSTFLRPEDHPTACNIHVDSPRFISNFHSGIIMTLALDDFTEENGATYYLPGSHKSEKAPDEKEFYDNSVRVVRKAGDVVFFSNRVYHAGGGNQTNQTRHGITIYACRHFMKQRFDYPKLVTEEILAQIGDRGHNFLGFNSRVPLSCHEYYTSPEKRMYQPNQD